MPIKGIKRSAALDEGAPPDASDEAIGGEAPAARAQARPVAAPAPVPVSPTAPPAVERVAEDLSSVAPEGLPVAPEPKRAALGPAPVGGVDLEAAVKEKFAEMGAALPSPAAAPPRVMPAPLRAPTAARVESASLLDEPAAPHGGESAFLAEPEGIEGAPVADDGKKDPEKEEVDPEEEEERLANAADAVMALLRASGEPDDVTRRIARDYVELLGDTFKPRKQDLDARQAAQDIEDKRRAGLEAGRQANAGRGGAISSLVGAMLGMGRNRRTNALSNDVEAYNRDYNRTAGDFRDRIYAHRLGQFTEGLTHVGTEGETLKAAVTDYNKAFLKAPAAAPLAGAFNAWKDAQGLDEDQASRLLGEGKAPPEVAAALASVRDAVLADPDIAIRRETMLRAEDRFAEQARKAASDAEILAKNFHDKDFEVSEARDLFCKGLQEVAKDIPDPIGEEESRQKMKERMRELVEGIRRAFDAIMDAVARLVSRSAAPAA